MVPVSGQVFPSFYMMPIRRRKAKGFGEFQVVLVPRGMLVTTRKEEKKLLSKMIESKMKCLKIGMDV